LSPWIGLNAAAIDSAAAVRNFANRLQNRSVIDENRLSDRVAVAVIRNELFASAALNCVPFLLLPHELRDDHVLSGIAGPSIRVSRMVMQRSTHLLDASGADGGTVCGCGDGCGITGGGGSEGCCGRLHPLTSPVATVIESNVRNGMRIGIPVGK
jgi:hypothetical protein